MLKTIIKYLLIICLLITCEIAAVVGSQGIKEGDRIKLTGKILAIELTGDYIKLDGNKNISYTTRFGNTSKTGNLVNIINFKVRQDLANLISSIGLKEGDLLSVNVIATQMVSQVPGNFCLSIEIPDQYEYISIDKDYENKRLGQKFDEKNRALKAQQEAERARSEAEFQAAQEKMRIGEEKEKLKEQRIADLKSGKMKITTIEDAKLAFSPSSDNKYTIGLPIDGLTGSEEYYIWTGTLSWKSGNLYFCLDNSGGQTRCFGFTDIIVRFNEMRENSFITVVGQLRGTSQVTLVNKLSGVKEDKNVPILSNCYIL